MYINQSAFEDKACIPFPFIVPIAPNLVPFTTQGCYKHLEYMHKNL